MLWSLTYLCKKDDESGLLCLISYGSGHWIRCIFLGQMGSDSRWGVLGKGYSWAGPPSRGGRAKIRKQNLHHWQLGGRRVAAHLLRVVGGGVRVHDLQRKDRLSLFLTLCRNYVGFLSFSHLEAILMLGVVSAVPPRPVVFRCRQLLGCRLLHSISLQDLEAIMVIGVFPFVFLTLWGNSDVGSVLLCRLASCVLMKWWMSWPS